MAVSLILAMSLADVESAAVLDVDWLSAVEAVEVAEVFDRVDELMVGENQRRAVFCRSPSS